MELFLPVYVHLREISDDSSCYGAPGKRMRSDEYLDFEFTSTTCICTHGLGLYTCLDLFLWRTRLILIPANFANRPSYIDNTVNRPIPGLACAVITGIE
jgi:hypothetical protein